MGPRFDRLRYEVFQNLFLSPMNTGSVRPAVATTPTARGIETRLFFAIIVINNLLQQHLPLAVLKLHFIESLHDIFHVATTPTARGIETMDTHNYVVCPLLSCNNTYRSRY